MKTAAERVSFRAWVLFGVAVKEPGMEISKCMHRVWYHGPGELQGPNG